LLVLLLAAVGGLTFIAINTFSDINTPSEETPVPTEPPGGIPIDDLRALSVDRVTTNLHRSPTDRGAHFLILKISIQFDVREQRGVELFEFASGRMEIILDAILEVANTTTKAEVESIDGRNIVKDRILALLRDAFRSTLIYDISIEEWIVQ
jgi:flagellar basal body-associated protein FliL